MKNSASFEKGALIIKRFILDQMAAVYSILTLDFNRLLAILFSHLWLIYNFRALLSIRNKNKLRYQSLDLIYNGSIAMDYFFKRKKYFNQIFE